MNKKRETKKRFDGFDWLLPFIFKKIYPIWKLHEGEVLGNVLAELDEYWDWPRGTAKCAVERLNRDRRLTEKLGQHFASKTIPSCFYLGQSK